MIELFPASSIDNSILTSVWIGLLVTWVLHETLGWEFTGLVVPGYLASVFIIQPTTAVVIALEAMVTYLIVHVLSEWVPKLGMWFPLFGRDRFFLVLLVSVLVRLVLEGGGFSLLAQAFGVGVSADLHSMGLVVVPLAANALNRAGLGRGVPRLLVPLVITWIVIEGFLLRYTNLSLSSFELTYEDLAVDFVSSPRGYILLLFGAWVGSRVNVRWGWDFGGIIVPGLLALCWLNPVRLVATIGEVLVVIGLVRLVMRIEWVRAANVTGARPVMLAFTLAYIVKYGLAWALGSAWPGLRATDLFGFGYLLPSLIAVRALRIGDWVRPVVAAVSSSGIGFVLASGLGYALHLGFPPEAEERERPPGPRKLSMVDALRAATVDDGVVPDAGLHLDRADAERLVWGGDGFGSLWGRPGRRPLSVVGRRGREGMGLATLAVAELLDARAVLLCARPGPACDDAIEALRLRGPVLSVVPGEETLLAADGDALERLGLSPLGEAGVDFRFVGAAAHPQLSVALRDRAILADAVIGRDPGPLVPPSEWDDQALLDTNPHDLSALRTLDEGVLQPLLAWRANRPHAEPSLRVAVGVARALGLDVQMDEDGRRIALLSPDLRLVMDRQGDGMIVHVPFSLYEPHAGELGLLVMATQQAAVYVEDTPPDLRSERYDRERLGHVAVLRSLADLGEGADILAVRGIRDTFDPGSEAVLAFGRPWTQAAEAPRRSMAVRRWLDRLDVGVGHYDGRTRRLSFLDPLNPVRVAGAAATGDHAHATMWVRTELRERMRPVRGDHPLAGVVTDFGRYSRRPLGALESSLVDEVDPAWAGFVAAVDEVVQGRGGVAVSGAARAAHGARVTTWCEPWLGCRWLIAERCDGGSCSGVIAPLAGRYEASERMPQPVTALEAMLGGTRAVGFVGAPEDLRSGPGQRSVGAAP